MGYTAVLVLPPLSPDLQSISSFERVTPFGIEFELEFLPPAC